MPLGANFKVHVKQFQHSFWGNMREEINYDQSHDTASHKAQSMQNKHSGKKGGLENCSKCFMASEITRDAAA